MHMHMHREITPPRSSPPHATGFYAARSAVVVPCAPQATCKNEWSAPTSAAHPRSHRSQQEQRDRARSSIRTGCPLVDSEEETGS